jgi:hypothetical protein
VFLIFFIFPRNSKYGAAEQKCSAEHRLRNPVLDSLLVKSICVCFFILKKKELSQFLADLNRSLNSKCLHFFFSILFTKTLFYFFRFKPFLVDPPPPPPKKKPQLQNGVSEVVTLKSNLLQIYV